MAQTLDQLLREYRKTLLAIDVATARGLIAAHRAEVARLRNLLTGLTAALRAAGETREINDPERWMRDSEAAGRLLAAAEQGMADFGAFAAERIEARRLELIELARVHDEAITYASITGGQQVTPGTANAIRAAFSAIPVEAVSAAVGALQPSSPLRTLFDGFGEQASRQLGEKLIDGITRGRGAEQIARTLRESLDGNAARALTIARTETHRAYRSASLERYRANPRVYAGWRWHANLDTRTCPVCIAMHGSEHSLDETFGAHPNCRCRPLPITRTISEILNSTEPEALELDANVAKARAGRETGQQWFDRQPSSVQLQILGPTKLREIKRGTITLADTVVRTEHPRWGLGRRTASAREALRQSSGRRLATRRTPGGGVSGGDRAGPPKPPPVPPNRVEYGREWRAAWERAHREMAIYDRAPSVHLIDQFVVNDPERRGWMTDRFDWLASTTQLPGGRPDLTNPDRTVWKRPALRPDTMETVIVRVVLDGNGREILTAMPE